MDPPDDFWWQGLKAVMPVRFCAVNDTCCCVDSNSVAPATDCVKSANVSVKTSAAEAEMDGLARIATGSTDDNLAVVVAFTVNPTKPFSTW